MIPQYRPIYTPVHVHLVCGSILFPSSGGNSLVAKLSSGEPGVVGSSPGVSTSPLTNSALPVPRLQPCAVALRSLRRQEVWLGQGNLNHTSP